MKDIKIEVIKSIKVKEWKSHKYIDIGNNEGRKVYRLWITSDSLINNGYIEFPIRGARIERIDNVLFLFPDTFYNVFYVLVRACADGRSKINVLPRNAVVYPFTVFNPSSKIYRYSMGALISAKSDMVSIEWKVKNIDGNLTSGITSISVYKDVYNFQNVQEFKRAFGII
jgi:hypothetical protein